MDTYDIDFLAEQLKREVTSLVLSVQVEKKLDQNCYLRLIDVLKNITVTLKDVECVPKLILLNIHVAINSIINERPYLSEGEVIFLETVVSTFNKYFYYILTNETYDERVPGVPRIF
ncbi:hypothetical protein LDJ79_07005 [Vibrio tritonius]|uniref:Uncharacterized protein n=1 Tax=Vibrio tritonius TaxID=1435069 RepID=A0ABS7YJK1_9VIBR|nr:hypothetical protein [Vibrio tritonius]MCA2015854.1 hypothetical protein [Vibrio tritonius]